MSKKKSRIIALVMLVVGVVFIVFAMGHPEMSFPWGNTIAYILYIAYLLAMAVFFVAPFKKK